MTVPADIEAFATAIGPRPDEILSEMEDRAAETDFPTVGPAVGGWLQQLAGLTEAERVFEFGSGFGYSAYWFARGLSADGEIVLTEIDTEELEEAREYLERGGVDDRARFEPGDAIETIERYEGPFDIALVDNEKHRYVEAFEAIRRKIPVGGLVVADNAIEGPFEFETIRRLYLGDGESKRADDAESEAAGGIAAYLDHVESLEAFETTLLPLGEGLVVSRRVRSQ